MLQEEVEIRKRPVKILYRLVFVRISETVLVECFSVSRPCTTRINQSLVDKCALISSGFSCRTETDDVYVTTKHLRRYSLPDISDTESSEDDEDQPEGEDSDGDDDVSSTGNASRSWCTIS